MQSAAATVPSRPSLSCRTELTLLKPMSKPLATAKRLLPASCREPAPEVQQCSRMGGRRPRKNDAPKYFRCLTRMRTMRPIIPGLSVVVITLMN